MAQQPSTPVKVPSSAANYTPATLDPDLRSQINTVLLRDGHVAKYVAARAPSSERSPPAMPTENDGFARRAQRRTIQEALLHALNSHPSNWPTAVQAHALTLLRDGDVSTYPALLRRVLDDVRASSSSASSATATATATAKNGSKTPNGDTPRKVNGTTGTAAAGGAGLALPEAVIEEALRVARESLEAVCEIEDGAS
ncbi:hypothetical protein TOPH_03159 [Tolypocladium ophioglossoides CBS 100239]|uniref:Uncharacterized protein n=1 Tax=Tolypocladium ophioglossoides (strain CBS 100239) TaxID=1163406 RepID=A0A0L0NDN6_TOLOC|nr:hypothetical protein TOPH_03159 [Tolypocladium ophioglossoides CBS 100239]